MYGDAVPPDTRASDAAGSPPARARPVADLAAPPALVRAPWPRPLPLEAAPAPAVRPRVPADFAAPARLPAAALPAACAPPRADSALRRVEGVPLLAGVWPGVPVPRAPVAILRAGVDGMRSDAFFANADDVRSAAFFADAGEVRPAVFFADADAVRPAVFFAVAVDVRPAAFFTDADDARPEACFAEADEARPADSFAGAVPVARPLPAARFEVAVPAVRDVPAPLPAVFPAAALFVADFFAAGARIERPLPSPVRVDAFFDDVRPAAVFAPARPVGLAARVFSPVVVAMGFSVSRRGADCAQVW